MKIIISLLLVLISQGSAHACVRIMTPDGNLTDCPPEPPGHVLRVPKCTPEVGREYKTQLNIVLSLAPSDPRWRVAKERVDQLTKQCF
jgi:hypothetical protein